jgi:hypothetical protein
MVLPGSMIEVLKTAGQRSGTPDPPTDRESQNQTNLLLSPAKVKPKGRPKGSTKRLPEKSIKQVPSSHKYIKGPKKRPRRCGRCLTHDHNVRTCLEAENDWIF